MGDTTVGQVISSPARRPSGAAATKGARHPEAHTAPTAACWYEGSMR